MTPVSPGIQDLDEKELIRRAKVGDQNAFGDLWLVHIDRLSRLVNTRAWIVPQELRKDYLQHLYLVVARRISGYREDDREDDRDFFGFLKWTALQKDEQWRFVRKQHERKSFSVGTPSEDDETLVLQVMSPTRLILEDLIKNETEASVQKATQDRLDQIFSMETAPHHLLVFGLNRLLPEPGQGSEQSLNSKLGWKPRKIVASDLWICRLRALLAILATSVFEVGSSKLYLARSLAPLYPKMDQALGEVLKHHKTLETYRNLLDQVTGNLRLREYYEEFRQSAVRHIEEKKQQQRRQGKEDASEATPPTPEGAITRWIGYVV